MHLPTTFSVALLLITNAMPHWYSSPSSNSVTLLMVTVVLIYTGVAAVPLVRLLTVVYRIISTVTPSLSHKGAVGAPDGIKITHVNTAISSWHAVVLMGCCTTVQV